MKNFALSENYEIFKPPKIGGLGVEKLFKIPFSLIRYYIPYYIPYY